MILRHFIGLCTLSAGLLGGCATEGKSYTRWGGEGRSYHPLGEKVSVEFTMEDQPEIGVASAAAATAVVGYAVDFVADELEREAARHSQQYSGSAYATQEFNTITLTRKAKRKGEGGAVLASKSTFRIVPRGNNLHEVILDKIEISLAKAKVKKGELLDVDYSMSVEGTWLTAGNELQRHSLMMGGNASVKDLDISGGVASDNTNRTVGFVYLPPFTENSVALNVSIVASERDASKAAELFTSGAELIRENRSDVINFVAP